MNTKGLSGHSRPTFRNRIIEALLGALHDSDFNHRACVIIIIDFVYMNLIRMVWCFTLLMEMMKSNVQGMSITQYQWYESEPWTKIRTSLLSEFQLMRPGMPGSNKWTRTSEIVVICIICLPQVNVYSNKMFLFVKIKCVDKCIICGSKSLLF